MSKVSRTQLADGTRRKDRPRKRKQSFNGENLEMNDDSFMNTSAKKLKVKIKKEESETTDEHRLSGILDIMDLFKENISEDEMTLNLSANNATSDTKLLIKLIMNMAADVKRLTKEVHEMKEIFQSKFTNGTVTIAPGQNFQTKYLLDLPLRTLEDFDTFDEKIKEDEEFRQDFVQSLLVLFDRDNKLSRTFTNMLRRYLSRELAMKFTATKQSATKLVFKDTNFCACMLDMTLQLYEKDSTKGSSMTEKKFYQTLSSIFPNAKDWNGCRSLRRKAALTGFGEDDEIEDGDAE